MICAGSAGRAGSPDTGNTRKYRQIGMLRLSSRATPAKRSASRRKPGIHLAASLERSGTWVPARLAMLAVRDDSRVPARKQRASVEVDVGRADHLAPFRGL